MFVSPSRPQKGETSSPSRAQTGKLPPTDQLSRGERSPPCFSPLRVCVAFRSVLLFSFPPHSLILPPSWLTLGAAGGYLELTLMCIVIPAPAGGWNKTHIHTKTSVYTQRTGEITGLCMVSVHTVFLLLILCLLNTFFTYNPSESDPQCTAHAFICAEMVWSYIIHGSCDLGLVSYGRSNKME